MYFELKCYRGRYARLPGIEKICERFSHLSKNGKPVLVFANEVPESTQAKCWQEYQVSVCLGTACYVKGAGDIINALKQKIGIESGECTEDGKFSLVETRCIGCCGLAPVMTINSNVYGKLTTDQLDGILREYM